MIYGLVDPTSLLIFYVGCSTTGFRRPKEHRKRGDSPCREYVKNLQRDGLDYEIAVLESFRTCLELPAAEQWWIAYGKGCGWPLTNQTKGGELNTEEIRDRAEDKRRTKLASISNFKHDSEARKLNLCMLIYKEHGAVCALETARGCLADAHMELQMI